MKRLLVIVSTLLLLLPVAALAIPNPLRVFLPQMYGLTCDSGLCAEDRQQLVRAQALVAPATTEVRERLGAFNLPTVIFCSSQDCYDRFGRRSSTSVSFGGTAVLIGPRGWAPHYLRHELIHIVQFQRLGLIRAWRAPAWLWEGMAYSLSGDPRRPLPGELEALRIAFERWYHQETGEVLWGRTTQTLDARSPSDN